MLPTLGFLLIIAYVVSDVQALPLNLSLTRTENKNYDIRVDTPRFSCNNTTHELIVTESGKEYYALFDSTIVTERELTIRDFRPNQEIEVEIFDFCDVLVQSFSNRIVTGDIKSITPVLDLHRNSPDYRRVRLTAEPMEEGTVRVTVTIPQPYLKCDGDVKFSIRCTQERTYIHPSPASTAYIQDRHTFAPVQLVLEPWAEYMLDVGVWCRSAVTILYGFIEVTPGKLPRPKVSVSPSVYLVRVSVTNITMEREVHFCKVKVCPSPDLGERKCSHMETMFRETNTEVTMGPLLSDTSYELTVTVSMKFNGALYYSEPLDIEFRTLRCGAVCSGLAAIKNVTIHPEPASANFVIEYHENKSEIRFRIEVCPIQNASCVSIFVASQGNITVIKVGGLKPQTRYNATVTPEKIYRGVQQGPAYSQLFTTHDCSKGCADVQGNLSLELVHQPNYADILVGLPEETPCENPTYEIRCRNETIRLNSMQVAERSVTLRNFPYWSSGQRVDLQVSCEEVQSQVYVGFIATGPGRLNVISSIQVTRRDVQATVTVTSHDNFEVYPNRYRVDLCMTLQGTCNKTWTHYTGQTTTFELTNMNPKAEYTISVIPEFHYKGNWISGEKVTREIENAELKRLAKLLNISLIPPDEDGNAGFKMVFPAAQCGADHYTGYVYLTERVPDVPNFHPITSIKDELVYTVLECWTSYSIRIYCPTQEGYMERRIYTGPGPLRRPRFITVSATDTSAEIQINHRFYNASHLVEFEVELCEAHVWVCERSIIKRTGQVTVLKCYDLVPEATYLFVAVPRLISNSTAYLGRPLHTEFVTDECAGQTGCYDFHPIVIKPLAFSVVVQIKWSDRLGHLIRLTLNSTQPGIHHSRNLTLTQSSRKPVIRDLLPGVEYIVFVTPLGKPGAADVSSTVTTLECRFDCEDRSNRTLPVAGRRFVGSEVVYVFNLFKDQKCQNKSYVAATNIDGRPGTTRIESGLQNMYFASKLMLFTLYEVKALTWCDGKRSYLYDTVFEDYKDLAPVKDMQITTGINWAEINFVQEPLGPRRRYEITYCLQSNSICKTKLNEPFANDVYVNITELNADTEYSVVVKTLIVTGIGTLDGPSTPTVLFSTKPCHVNCPEPHEVVVVPINHEEAKVDIYTLSASRSQPVYLNVSWCEIGMQSCAFTYANLTTRNASLRIRSLKPAQKYILIVYEPNYSGYLPYHKVEFATPACGDKCGLEPYLGLTSVVHNSSATVTVIFPVFPCNERRSYNASYTALTPYGAIEKGPFESGTRVFKIHGLELWTSYSFRGHYWCGDGERKLVEGSIDTGPGPLHPVENITAETQEYNLEITIVDMRNPESTSYTVRTLYSTDEETSTVPREGPRTVVRRRTHDLISRGGNCVVYVTPWIGIGDVTYKGTTRTLPIRLHCTRLYPDPLCDVM